MTIMTRERLAFSSCKSHLWRSRESVVSSEGGVLPIHELVWYVLILSWKPWVLPIHGSYLYSSDYGNLSKRFAEVWFETRFCVCLTPGFICDSDTITLAILFIWRFWESCLFWQALLSKSSYEVAQLRRDCMPVGPHVTAMKLPRDFPEQRIFTSSMRVIPEAVNLAMTCFGGKNFLKSTCTFLTKQNLTDDRKQAASELWSLKSHPANLSVFLSGMNPEGQLILVPTSRLSLARDKRKTNFQVRYRVFDWHFSLTSLPLMAQVRDQWVLLSGGRVVGKGRLEERWF